MNETKEQVILDAAQSQRRDSIRRFRRAERARSILQNAGIGIPFVLIFALCFIAVPNFSSKANLTNLVVNSGILALVGFGMTIIIAMRGIDLSVGSAQALIACSVALAVNEAGFVLGGLIGLGIGLVLGIFNGLIITALKVPDFIATLSTMSIFRGAVLLLTAGAPIMIESQSFRNFAPSHLLFLPQPFVVAVLAGAAAWLIMNDTSFGKHIVAVGTNPSAAKDNGISVKKVIVCGYALAGIFSGIAGILIASQLGVVNGSISTGLELQTIAIVVLGGTSMVGGRPRMLGTFVAAVLLSTINSGLNLLNVPSFYQYVALGALLIFALGVDSAQRAAVKKLLYGRGK
ncbi:ABC transporter permease [Trueperella sp. LYQ143]|uniref:ABC transporter permease n=1 Tax=unclassified Trueperella TaxID=2630174 RepID=UPI0039833E28